MQSSVRPEPNRAPDQAPMARDAGFSLIEGLMAAALLLVVAVSILPLFMRALESNTRGGRASQVTTLAVAAIEQINQTTVDHDDYQLEGGVSGVRETGTMYWDMGPFYAEGSPAAIGDEQWVSDKSAATGQVLWMRELDVRKYSFADVHGTIKVGGSELSTLGDPRWFDSPLITDNDGDLYNAHITEFRVHLVEDRLSGTLNSGQRITIGHFRTF